jgi:hypothetical protein
MRNKRGDIEFGDEGIPGWVIAIVILVIMLSGYLILKEKLLDGVKYVINMFRMRGV